MSTKLNQHVLNYITDINDFDVWECVARCEVGGDVDGTIDALRAYQEDNSTALLDLINVRFNDLVVLSKTLSEIKEVTNEIKYPLIVLEKQTSEKIKTIKTQIEDVIKQITDQHKENERLKQQQEEKKILNCYNRLNTNLQTADSVEIVEIACYQLEMLKYLVHIHNTAPCVQNISKKFDDIENKIHELLEMFLLEYATANNQEQIEICSNCYHLLGEMDLSERANQNKELD
ncbi:Conserved oligomeric Golgi complex subunit 2 [Entamoeba marina]